MASAKKTAAKSATKTKVSVQGRNSLVASKSVKASTKNYVVTSPSGSQVILENEGLTSRQAAQLALPLMRRDENVSETSSGL